MDRFGIKLSNGDAIIQPGAVIVGASFDAKEIRICNQMNGIQPIIPINVRNRKKNELEMPIEFIKSSLRS
jgi:hypothetical protein